MILWFYYEHLLCKYLELASSHPGERAGWLLGHIVPWSFLLKSWSYFASWQLKLCPYEQMCCVLHRQRKRFSAVVICGLASWWYTLLCLAELFLTCPPRQGDGWREDSEAVSWSVRSQPSSTGGSGQCYVEMLCQWLSAMWGGDCLLCHLLVCRVLPFPRIQLEFLQVYAEVS